MPKGEHYGVVKGAEASGLEISLSLSGMLWITHDSTSVPGQKGKNIY